MLFTPDSTEAAPCVSVLTLCVLLGCDLVLGCLLFVGVDTSEPDPAARVWREEPQQRPLGPHHQAPSWQDRGGHPHSLTSQHISTTVHTHS